MFGYKTVRSSEFDALQTRISTLEGEIKGYYENREANNQYFKAIAALLHGNELDNINAAISRADRKSVV